jgi:hypothetical protein
MPRAPARQRRLSTLLFLLFNCAVAFVAYWSYRNDKLADGTTVGLLAMRNPTERQASDAEPAVQKKRKPVALLKPSMSFRGTRRK